MLKSSGFPPSRLQLEVTETYVLEKPERARAAIANLKALGTAVALDDFGTGYSNLDYLSKISFDIIKIDKIFTDAIGIESVSFRMLKMMLEMLAQTGSKIIVEGIEEQHQADFLLAHYPKIIAQGWLYGKPVDIGKIRS